MGLIGWSLQRLVIMLSLASTASATALTAMLGANERSCYYADVDGAGEKVGTSWQECYTALL
jgi:hypothetical protein